MARAQVHRTLNQRPELQSFYGTLESFGKPAKRPKPDREGDSDVQLQQLSRLRLLDRVIPVSYDYLKEVNCSGAAFLICNASLGLTGKKWSQCKSSVNLRSSKLWNKSPPHGAVDAVRLARDFYEIKQAL